MYIKRRLLLSVLAAGLLSLPALAQAGTVAFTSDTTIGCSDMTYEDYDITVGDPSNPNVTLTVDCAHTFYRLTLQNGARLVHTAGQAGLHLTITTDLAIDSTSKIDLTGLGYAGGQGPGAGGNGLTTAGGGGAYGGNGSWSQSQTPGGSPYGSYTQPVDLGSGGGHGLMPGNLGVAGGGAIRLTVGGTLTVDGQILAIGLSSPDRPYPGGAGAGGSIWIETGTLAGLGLIHALGGYGDENNSTGSGCGGGGRIAIYYAQNNFQGLVSAAGGDDTYAPRAPAGGAGTVFWMGPSSTYGDLVFDNLGRDDSAPTTPVGVGLVDNLIVRNEARLGHEPAVGSLDLTVAGDLTIDVSGDLNVVGRGYPGGDGPGAGSNGTTTAGGGGAYGGNGGWSSSGIDGGLPYGSYTQPVEYGSGGGTGDVASGMLGRAGAGAIRLTVGGTLTVDGRITANGLDCWDSPNPGGAGAGGSIWIETGTLAGIGLIQAQGGYGDESYSSDSGSGGGGRIAIYYTQNSFQGQVSAAGGDDSLAPNAKAGGAGTVFWMGPSNTNGDLVFDNLGRNDSAPTTPVGVGLVDSLTVSNQAVLGHDAGGPGLLLQAADSITIETLGSILVNGAGHPYAQGPGTPEDSQTLRGAGAGHGGGGGNSADAILGGAGYGSLLAPVALGSGGGNGNPPNLGGNGGGSVHLVADTIQMDGVIEASGTNGASTAGGGSGGSIFLEAAASMSGFGIMRANGGAGSGGGGGGAGGRIALVSPDTSGWLGLAEAKAGNSGGSGAEAGDEGSVYLSDRPGYYLVVPDLVAGAAATVEVVGATPNKPQYVTYSLTGRGSYSIPKANVTLDIDSPFLGASGQADPSGHASWSVMVPGSTRGIMVWLQAFEPNRTTNRYATRIQ